MKYKVPNFVEMVDLARCSTFFIFLQFAWNFLVKRSKHVWSIDFRNHFLTPNIILLPCNTTFLSTTVQTLLLVWNEARIIFRKINSQRTRWEMRRRNFELPWIMTWKLHSVLQQSISIMNVAAKCTMVWSYLD